MVDMGDKFNFNVASELIEVIEATASSLEIKNGQMEKHFGNLREGFKDDRYEEYALDMSSADASINKVIEQLHTVSRQIGKYAERLSREV